MCLVVNEWVSGENRLLLLLDNLVGDLAAGGVVQAV